MSPPPPRPPASVAVDHNDNNKTTTTTRNAPTNHHRSTTVASSNSKGETSIITTPTPTTPSFPPLPLVLRARRDKRRQLTTTTTTTAAAGGGGNSSSSSSLVISLHHLRDLLSFGPKEVLALAVRFDESRQDEALLKAPLESGRLYADVHLFVQALEYLQEQTKPRIHHQHQHHPSISSSSQQPTTTTTSTTGGGSSNNSSSPNRRNSSSNNKNNNNNNNNKNNQATTTTSSSQQQQQLSSSLTSQNSTASSVGSSSNNNNNHNKKKNPMTQHPPYALTPIILSGLLTALQEQRDTTTTTTTTTTSDTTTTTTSTDGAEDWTSDLVLSCQAMRQAAIRRIRLRKKRYQIQRIVLPITSISILFVLYLRTMSDLRSTLIQLGYVRSCEGMPAYAPACRIAEAALWWRYRDYLIALRQQCSGGNHNNKKDDAIAPDCNEQLLLQRKYREAPFTLHTTLIHDTITFEELDNPASYQPSLLLKTANDQNHHHTSLRWLGDSAVNRLVRETIEQYLPLTMDWKILDAGCGVGGTLYALLPETDTRRKIQEGSFRYHGIAASAAEITFAKTVLKYYQLDQQYSENNNIVFEQRSFEANLQPNTYTAAVAIESLAFSRNLDNTLSNLIKSLQTGGLLIIMDDVVYPTLKVFTDEHTTPARPSLLSHDTWKASLENMGCKVIVARDLSLEYEMIHETISSSYGKTITTTNGGAVIPNALDVGGGGGTTSSTSDSWLWGGAGSAPFLLLEQWMATTGNAASQRLIELRQEKRVLETIMKRRKQAYQSTIISYNFYVCVKTY